MTEQPETLEQQIDAIFEKANQEAAQKKAQRLDAASQREDAFTKRVAEAAHKAANALAREMASEKKTGHSYLPTGETEEFYRALAEIMRPRKVSISMLLLTSEGQTIKGVKELNAFDGTTISYSYFAHFGPAQAIIEHMQGYDARGEGEVIKTY